ncbi:MAG: hypothetical protein V4719_25150, partial [Planctomycetota bacterium]
MEISEREATSHYSGAIHQSRPWRVWPGVLILALYWAFLVWVYLAEPEQIEMFPAKAGGALVVALGLTLWWLIYSKASTAIRWLSFLAMVAGLVLSVVFRANAIPIALLIYGLPTTCTIAIAVAWFVADKPDKLRYLPLFCILASWLSWSMMRFDGMTSTIMPRFSFRWQPTSEDRFL